MSRVPSNSARRARRIAAGPAVGFRPAGAALAVAAAFVLHPAMLHAQPSGAEVIHGFATLAGSGNNLVVTTLNGAGTNYSAINWQSFSIPAGSMTQFIQPSAASTSINRVVGNDPSAIFGTLRSNGKLVLVNPAGIAVGAGAVVDTAGFTASTLNMTDADALAGRLNFAGESAGLLQVDGRIVARNGDVVLIGPQVQVGAGAVVQSIGGATVLAAGNKVAITGRGLEGIHLEVQAGNEARNLGTLRGDAVGMFAHTLRHSGLIEAQAATTEGGRVVLKAMGGDALVSGGITASAGDKGGSIDVLGERVGLLAGANLDASGAEGGGQVRVGGDYQGLNADVPNAKRTYVDAAAVIKADATVAGEGGRVIVWSDEMTRMNGQISARGGAQGGNGGFAEVSGKKYLEFTGLVDLRAPQGEKGLLLLDPEDITIVRSDSTTSSNTFPTTPDTPFPETNNAAGTPSAMFEPSSTGVVTLTDTQLKNQLGVGDVLVKTSSSVSTGAGGQITVNSDAVVDWTSDSSLTLLADKGIAVHGTLYNATSSVAGIHLYANNGAIEVGPTATVQAATIELVTKPGHDISIQGGSLWAANGPLTLSSGRDVLLGTIGDPAAVRYTYLDSADKLSITAAGSVRAGIAEPAPYPSYVYLAGAGGAGKGVAIAAGGDVDLSVNTSVEAWSSPLTVTAGGSILGQAYYAAWDNSTPDGTGTAINLTAGGSISFGTIDTSGYSEGAGQHGGNVTLTAGSGNVTGYDITTDAGVQYGSDGDNAGSVTVNAGGSIDIGYISATGGEAYEGEGAAGQGGRAGAVTLNAGTGISIGGIDAYGGSSNGSSFAPGNGGVAGTVTLGTTGGGIDVDYIDAGGGWGSQGAMGGTVVLSAPGDVRIGAIGAMGGDSEGAAAGGQGGSVRISAGGNLVFTSPYGAGVAADGGWSQAGIGGQGGAIDVKVGGGLVVDPDEMPALAVTFTSESGYYGFSASGGAGGYGTSGSAGGRGGSVRIQGSGSSLLLDASLMVAAVGGEGGGASEGTGGTGGAGGSIDLLASGGPVVLRSPQLLAVGGQGGYNPDGSRAASGTLGTLSAMGTSVEVEGDFDLNAIWNNSSNVHIRGSSYVYGQGVFRNLSDVSLYDTASLDPSGGVENLGRLRSFGSATKANLQQNAGLVEVVAGSTLWTPSFTSNSGTVQVDGTLEVGTSSRVIPPPLDCFICTFQAAAITSGMVFNNLAGGVLGGNGSMVVDGGGGTVDNFGTIAPGGAGAIGTFSIFGNLTMESGSTVATDVLNTSSYDAVAVSGTAVTGGSYAVTYLPGAIFAAGDTFNVLRAGVLDATTLPTVTTPELTPLSSGNDLLMVATTAFPVAAPPPPPAVPLAEQEVAEQQVTSQVVTFATLFIQEAQQQQEDEAKDNEIGKDDIVVTDTACKAS